MFNSRRVVRAAKLMAVCGLAGGVATAVAGCSGSTPSNGTRPLFTEAEYGVSSSARVVRHSGPVRKGGGHYKLGRPYNVAGRWYVPREEPGYDRTGVGSWYGADFHGRLTSNGEIFDKNALTAAHPTFPLPSYAYVTNLENGRTVLVRVNDRGPYVANRIIDLSHTSARHIGYDTKGHARVRVQYAGRAPLSGDDSRERRFAAETRGGRSAGRLPPASTAYAPRPSAPVLAETTRSDAWSPSAYRLGQTRR